MANSLLGITSRDYPIDCPDDCPVDSVDYSVDYFVDLVDCIWSIILLIA